MSNISMHIAKKSLGQNFLIDDNIAGKFVSSLKLAGNEYKIIVEVGPGKGRLSKQIISRYKENCTLYFIEIDKDLAEYLKKVFPFYKDQIFDADFLKLDFKKLTNDQQFGLIGSFPYNISGQILFKIIHNRHLIPEIVGMFQKEVVQRIASGHGNKTYGIPSVLIQAYYKVEILFNLNENVFKPRPAVKSSVVRLIRKKITLDKCNDKIFEMTVKAAFSKRRKTLKNSMESLIDLSKLETIPEVFKMRAEQLSVEDFIELSGFIEKNKLLKS